MSSQVQEFIQTLVNSDETKMSLIDFFKTIHQKFYSNYDISFMEYFLELTAHEGEFVVHHEKLIECGIVTSLRSSTIKEKLDALGLVEEEEYNLQDILQVRENRGNVIKKVYFLTPEAFKTCLLRARRYSNQKVDPTIYSKYYLLLEKIYKLYIDYEKQLLSIQLKSQTYQLQQKDNQIEEQAKQLEEQQRYTLDLKEGLLGNIPELDKTQIVYIATSHSYAKRNLFKVGGTEHEDRIVSRLCGYNTGRAAGDDMFYTNIYKVNSYSQIEKRLEKLIGSFLDRKNKEMYRLCYDNLTYILGYIVDHFNDEVNEVNKTLELFVSNLNRYDKPVPVVPLILAQIHQHEKPGVVLAADTPEKLAEKMTEYVGKLDKDTRVVKAKEVFDMIGVKSDRRSKYSMLRDIINHKLPNAKMLRF